MQIEDSYPLSPVQHGMIVHSLAAPDSGVYVQQLVCGVREELNVSAFQRAWQGLVKRHAVFRTGFNWRVAGEPVQEVYRDVQLPFTYQDWTSLAPPDQQEHLRRFLQMDRVKGFKLDKAPLMRLAVFRYSPAYYCWVWTSHHAVLDGRSRLVVLKELFALYHKLAQGKRLRLESPRPYREYIDWLSRQNLAAAETFWRRSLSGFNLPTSLEVKCTSVEAGEEKFGTQHLRLSNNLTRDLQSLAQQHQLTINTLLQGAWSLLLSRYSGEEKVVFGATRAGRHSSPDGSESVVGPYINTLPVCVHVSPNSSPLEWLMQLRSQWIAMREFEHTPLVQIQKWAQVPAGSSMFETLLTFENYELSHAVQQLDHANIAEVRLIGTTNYPIAVTGYLGKEILLDVTYDRGRFENGTIARLLGHLRSLLEGFVSYRTGRLSDLPLLTAGERQLLKDWNDTRNDYPKHQPIQEVFEQQAERTPNRVAVTFEDQQLTYRELNRRANQLAHYLRKLGVGPEVLVGVCVERSVEMIVGLLGILKAGGAYVPLDPSYPHERLDYMLRDVKAPVLLTQERLANRLIKDRKSKIEDSDPRSSISVLSEVEGLDPQTKVVCLDRDWSVIGGEPEVNPGSTTAADNLAYVMYTSGSTGKPKGVSITHRGVMRLVKGTHYAELTEKEVFLQFAPLSFDASTFEIWGSLLNGAKLVVFPPHMPSLEELGEGLKQTGVTTLWLTSALFQLLVENHIQSLSGVKQLLAGGDVLSVAHVRKALNDLPGCRLINGYGPTENTTFTCCYPMTAAAAVGESVSIGRPIANTQVYLLDHDLNRVPIGVPGELYVGGDGVARGYCNNADLTAEKFLPHLFSNEPGARLYRTGDLACYLDDGNIKFLGRIDHQVKIRGFRIEAGEIEAVLGDHPAVRQTVVMARDDSGEEKQLVAYVVRNQQGTATVSELRSFLRRQLPDYMIPASFMFLDAMPLTPNGKLDRRALPTPEPRRASPEKSYVAPRTSVERSIAEIWTEVLKVERVGIEDNFFDLGGHSLLATQVIARVCDALQVEVEMRSLFDFPTVAGMAEVIETNPQINKTTLLPRVSLARRDKAPLSFAQQRLWFLEQLESGNSVYNISRSVKLEGRLEIVALERSVNELIRRHESLRTRFSVIDGHAAQIIAPVLTVTPAVVELSGIPKAEREIEALRLATEEAGRPFDLSCGPLLRITLLRLAAEEHILILTMHHIISDGWSMGVLFRELAALYDAFCAGKPLALPELPIQYPDFAVWQRQWLRGEILENQLSYWKNQLADAPARLGLPTDRPRPPMQTYRGSRQSLMLSEALTTKLKALSLHEKVSLFMTLLAAFQTLLYRYTGHHDIIIGSPIAGRNRSELEGLIGFFANTLVLRTDLSGDPSFRQLLGRVRKVALEAYAHQDLPFERLVEELKPERNFSHSPLFQLMFALQNAPVTALRLKGLTVNPLQVERETATFDLSLLMIEEAGALKGIVEYNTDLFDGTTIGRMTCHLQTLLEGITSNPDQRLSDLPLLTKAERQRLLVEWNDSKRDYPRDTCIHELFEAQVERTPDAIAVVFGEEQLTYRELNVRANQLAHYLSKLGVGPETLVGICLERSLEMVAGMLGVLKAGGAYVPLDPTYPKDRLAFMLLDSQARVMLTQSELLSQLPEMTGNGRPATKDGRERSPVVGVQSIICLDTDWDIIARESTENPVSTVNPENLAYVIYTSGSIGKPKGVLINHANITRLLHATHSWFHFDQNDVWTLFHSYAFDFSVWEMWGALLYGGRLVVVPYWVSRSPEMFYKLLSGKNVTVLNQTPSAFRQLIQAEESSIEPGELALRLVIFGGEALDFRTLRPWFDRHGDQHPRLVNMYGITETTVHVTYRPITAADLSGSRDNLIGVQLPDLEVYVLDQNRNPVPIGVPGELYVGGAGVGRGYLNRPDLTADRFIPNPFHPGQGERLYRSGDLVRYLPNRDIEYLGRIDAQIKIRGFRIELGEIESVLSQHPAVREAIVLAPEETENPKSESPNSEIPNSKSAIGNSQWLGRRLVAYVVSTQQPPTVTELNRFLRKKLPEYMVPASFVFLDALPLTPNGKVDRRNLPAPDQCRPEQESPFIAPRTPVEEVLANIWAELLKVKRVGIHDNFFELGGHSLLITQVASRIQQAFEVNLPLRTLFDAPTITLLSAAVATAQLEQEDAAEAAHMLRELEQLSPDEVKALLEAERQVIVP